MLLLLSRERYTGNAGVFLHAVLEVLQVCSCAVLLVYLIISVCFGLLGRQYLLYKALNIYLTHTAMQVRV